MQIKILQFNSAENMQEIFMKLEEKFVGNEKLVAKFIDNIYEKN